MTRRFFVATGEEIRAGRVTDTYFENAARVLREKGMDRPVVAEVRAKLLPAGWESGILCGMEEVLHLLEGVGGIEVDVLPEGSRFLPEEPVLVISGPWTVFGIHETAILGLLCQASGIATAAARCRAAAGDRLLLSFGARRQHPAIAPMIERAAWIGGADGVSSVLGAELLGLDPRGTMPHAMILVVGDTVEAARAFDEVIDPDVPRVVLIDTFRDEKFEAVRVAEALRERLAAVRLDTPASRRGDLAALVREVRWELDLRGFRHVKVFVSGGIGEEEIRELRGLVDGFGVGSAIARAPHVDFALDLVEVDGRPLAKRGKLSGRKRLWACPACGQRWILPAGPAPDHPGCPGTPGELLVPGIRGGAVVAPPEDARAARERALRATGFAGE